MKGRTAIANFLLVLLASGCSGGEPIEPVDTTGGDFCAEAVPLLQDDTIGDSPALLRAQMLALEDLAATLPESNRESLLLATQPLLQLLDLAIEGRAPGGWSSYDVVTLVGNYCDRTDLTSWIVQP